MAGVLITGFEPFGGEAVNPSWEVVKQLDGAMVAVSAWSRDSCPVYLVRL
jgi:pyrrolidone-carboxylate peptidase